MEHTSVFDRSSLGHLGAVRKIRGRSVQTRTARKRPQLDGRAGGPLGVRGALHSEAPIQVAGLHVTRWGFPLMHGRVRTSTACQGKTLREGVLIDCGRRSDGRHPMLDETWWVHLYVMLSRATKLEDLLLLRPPEAKFLERGPPKNLQRFYKHIDKHLKRGRNQACEPVATATQQPTTTTATRTTWNNNRSNNKRPSARPSTKR